MKESEIRPSDIFERYLELSASDADRVFRGIARIEIPCVACRSKSLTTQFEKSGFGYTLCNDCGTLFQSPRPGIDAFAALYRDSLSSRYWAETFFPAVAELRREKIFRPRVERMMDMCRSKGLKIDTLIDVGAGYGIFLEEWRARSPRSRLIAVEPSRNLADVCRSKDLEVVEEIVENVNGHDGLADLVVCFEVLEHVYDPIAFIRSLRALVRPGGHLFVSTLGVDGFDIQTLWDRSNSISPPHHINFLSIRGFLSAFEAAGLDEIDITTPGKLDVDIVRNAYAKSSDVLKGNRFAQFVVRDEARGAAFQDFLAANQMSSHVWVMARRPT